MKQAVILINPYLCTEREFYQPRRMKEALETRGVCAKILPNLLSAHIGREQIAEELSAQFDFCIYFDKDKYAPRMLEKQGMRLFNCAEAVEVCDDKMLTHIALSGVVPMPETIPAPLCYKKDADLSSFVKAGERLGYPVVVKECHGSFGQQVYLAKDEGELYALAEKLKFRRYLLQEFIAESAGRDLRAVCVGGEVVACMERTSDIDFRSNLELGGKGEARQADDAVKELCRKICAALSLDYCGVDLLFGKTGYLVCEVNSNAFFGGIERVTGIDVAGRYAAYICKKMYSE